MHPSAHAPQQEKPLQLEAGEQKLERSPHSPQLEKAGVLGFKDNETGLNYAIAYCAEEKEITRYAPNNGGKITFFVTLKRVGLSSKAPSFVSLNWEGML